jgi:hypothetical protein
MITCLWFDHGKAREAAKFPTSMPPPSPTATSVRAATPLRTRPSGPEGQELIVEFTACGRDFLGLNGGPKFVPNETVSFIILWNAIVSNGSQESMWSCSLQIAEKSAIRRSDLLATTCPERLFVNMNGLGSVVTVTREAASMARARPRRRR